jgi:phosphopantothenoylcysteine decarboxylase/phosphopantothenate--cysteine ligase
VQSAQEMLKAVLASLPAAQVLIMTAAVADFRPSRIEKEKIKKEHGLKELKLEPTADILAEITKVKEKINPHLRVIGFAAESQDLIENARKKMNAKKLELMVVNDISDPQAGFGVDTNKGTLLFPDGTVEELPLMKKSEVAEKIMQKVTGWLTK